MPDACQTPENELLPTDVGNPENGLPTLCFPFSGILEGTD
jgi:hypothetical protein